LQVVSISQNFINSDLDSTDNAVENKKLITIHSESTNDILEDGEVAEPDTDSDKLEPVITIHFRDSSISDIYKLKFMKVLQQFVELNPKENGNVINIFRDEALDPKEWIVLDGTVCIDEHSDGKIRFIRIGFKVKYRFTYRGNTCKMFTFNSKTKLTKKEKEEKKISVSC